MSSFTGDIVVKKVTGRLWEVYTPFEYHVGSEDSDDVVSVPRGFLTDFASVPRGLWNLFPPDGEYTAAAIVHDYLYTTHERTRRESDRIFYEAMGVLGVPKWKRWTMYKAVRWFGRSSWNKGYIPKELR